MPGCPVFTRAKNKLLSWNKNFVPRHNETKQSDGEVTVNLELWGMRSTPSLPLLLGPLWP